MILLNGHSLEARGILEPEGVALTLSERESSATVTTGMNILSVSTGDWIKDDRNPGAGIVWRVKTVDTQYDTETKTITLEHMIRSLSDRILDGETTPETIAGEGAVYCSALAAVEYILDRQSDWVLGDFDYSSVENPYSFNGDTLLAALETVTRSLSDPVWEYDFSSYPFTLHIRQRGDTVKCEMREGRNIATLKATIDRSRMYTRFYPVGKSDLRLPSPGYVGENENLYGIVEKTETDQSMDTVEKLEAWAYERLSRHSEPQVTITISGADLSASTGESLDSFHIGDQCRVPLPDYGTTISEKVVKLQWRDKIKDPESVTVTLANTLEDVQSILKKEKAESSKAGRGGAKIQKDNETIIGDVESGLYTRISQTAYEIRLEAHNEAESMRSIISQTAESIRMSVENDKESLRTLITQTASYIRQEAIDEANSLRSSITQTAESIRTEVANEAASIRSQVTQTASEWEARVSGVADSEGRVTAASIAVAINSAGEGEARIDADKVYIGNQKSTTVINGKAVLNDVTADYIASKVANIPTLNANGIICTSLTFQVGSNSYKSVLSFMSGVRSLQITGPSNNVYTLQYRDFYDDTWMDVGTFSRATTLSGAWSGGVYTVTASPQGNTKSTTLTDVAMNGSASLSTRYGNKYMDVPVQVMNENDVQVYTDTVLVNTELSYNKGVEEGEGKFSLASVTLQGQSQAVYALADSGGTVYYAAGSAVTLYNSGSSYTYYQGNGATVTGRGDAITRYTAGSSATYYLRNRGSVITLKRYSSSATTLYVAPTGGAQAAAGGAKKWWYEDSDGTNYFTSGGSAEVTLQGNAETVYAGNGATVTGRGDTVSGTNRGSSQTVTPVDPSDSLRLVGVTRYKAGSTVSDTYYTKNS